MAAARPQPFRGPRGCRGAACGAPGRLGLPPRVDGGDARGQVRVSCASGGGVGAAAATSPPQPGAERPYAAGPPVGPVGRWWCGGTSPGLCPPLCCPPRRLNFELRAGHPPAPLTEEKPAHTRGARPAASERPSPRQPGRGSCGRRPAPGGVPTPLLAGRAQGEGGRGGPGDRGRPPDVRQPPGSHGDQERAEGAGAAAGLPRARAGPARAPPRPALLPRSPLAFRRVCSEMRREFGSRMPALSRPAPARVSSTWALRSPQMFRWLYPEITP